jgi:DNA modification methylase
MKKKQLVWRNEKRQVKELLPFKNNPRTISEKQRSDLIKSIKSFGIVEVPVIAMDNKIIAGHQRVAVLQLMGKSDEYIDVRVPNRSLSEKEYKTYLLTSNRVHGDWDYNILSEHFDIDTMLISGFDDNDLSHIFADSLETFDDDFDMEKELETIKETDVKLGDIYALGPHRLACIDSLDPKAVKSLVGKNKMDMIYCDPIYNISLDYNKGVGGKASYGGKVNDSKSNKDYEKFLETSMRNALSVSKPDIHMYYWCDQKYIGLIQKLFSKLGLNNKRVCLWIKGPANPVPAVAFNKCYEPCVYATSGNPYLSPVCLKFSEVLNKEISPSGNKLLEDIMDLGDIWLNKRIAGQDYEHSTQKPITLHERPIKRCTKPGDKILDLFAGSGSTLLAADAMKRVCYTADIEPIFIQLIINRYESITKNKARKIN